MASEFIWRDPEAAKQAIAQMQVAAAAAENQSRERIAKEQTAAQRYATQSQIAERDKDRAVAREDIASRGNYRTDAATRERGNIQYSTIRDSITEFDPPTKKELEATMAMSPQLTDDLKNDLRALRDRAYKIAKANASMGAQTAKNYQAELNVKGLLDEAKAKIYERMAKDRNILFDRATGVVESAFRMPREDGPEPGSGVRLMPGQVPTIGEIKAQVGSRGTRPLIGALPPTGATITAQASPGVTPRSTDFAVPPPTVSDLYGPPNRASGRVESAFRPGWFTVPPELLPPTDQLSYGVPDYAPRIIDTSPKAVSEIPPFMDMSEPVRRMPTVSELYGPPNNALRFQSLPSAVLPPQDRSQIDRNVDYLIRFTAHPRFATLAPAEQQSIFNEIRSMVPRMYDMQTLRPEFIPQDPGYYVAPQ